jgi:hypothetical protein
VASEVAPLTDRFYRGGRGGYAGTRFPPCRASCSTVHLFRVWVVDVCVVVQMGVGLGRVRECGLGVSRLHVPCGW